MRTEYLLRQLEQVEAQISLAAASVCGIREEIEAANRPPPSEPEEDGDGNCLHPDDRRVDAGTMRDPNRFICSRCKEFVGGTK